MGVAALQKMERKTELCHVSIFAQKFVGLRLLGLSGS